MKSVYFDRRMELQIRSKNNVVMTLTMILAVLQRFPVHLTLSYRTINRCRSLVMDCLVVQHPSADQPGPDFANELNTAPMIWNGT